MDEYQIISAKEARKLRESDYDKEYVYTIIKIINEKIIKEFVKAKKSRTRIRIYMHEYDCSFYREANFEKIKEIFECHGYKVSYRMMQPFKDTPTDHIDTTIEIDWSTDIE